MEHANSKMMGRIAEIENCVLGGFVLDDRGSWVSIADKKASEDDFLAHLEAGRVLHNGQWVKFADAKNIPRHQHETQFIPNAAEEEETAFHALPAAGPPANSGFPVRQHENAAGGSGTAEEEETSPGLYAPETKIIQMQRPLMEIAETTNDPGSGYAMETGLYIVEHSYAANPVNAEQPGTKSPSPAAPEGKIKNKPAFVPPSAPRWEKDESAQKKRTLIIGVVIVGAVGIAAIAVIVLQVLR